MQTLDVIDAVVDLGLAGLAGIGAGVLFVRGRRNEHVTVRGRAVRHTGVWALSLVLLGVVLILRTAKEIVPTEWRGAVIAAMLVATAACIALSIVAVARSRRP